MDCTEQATIWLEPWIRQCRPASLRALWIIAIENVEATIAGTPIADDRVTVVADGDGTATFDIAVVVGGPIGVAILLSKLKKAVVGRYRLGYGSFLSSFA
jgi:hypothetical protein